MRGCDGSMAVTGRAMERLTIACMYEIGRRREVMSATCCVYVFYASWSGCAALEGVMEVNDIDRTIGLYEKRTCLLVLSINGVQAVHSPSNVPT